jgi:hypothetical protein
MRKLGGAIRHAWTQPFLRAEFYAIVFADVTVAVLRDGPSWRTSWLQSSFWPARPMKAKGVLELYSKS